MLWQRPSIQAAVQLGVDASMAEMRREVNEQNVKWAKLESDNCKLAAEVKILRSQLEHIMLNEVKNLRTRYLWPYRQPGGVWPA